MPEEVRARGRAYTISLWWPNDAHPPATLCGCPDVTPADAKKIAMVLKRHADNGFPNNRTKFKPVEDQLYEIKPTDQLRLIGFFKPNEQHFVIIHCERKKQDDLPPPVVKKAKKLREKYYESQGN